MSHLNVEIKAKSKNLDEIREILLSMHAEFRGTDHQIDTYFSAANGRLKLREGNIENCLVHYFRENSVGPKQSNVTLYKSTPGSSLKEILKNALGELVVVDKKREIYFIKNVKFHLDTVKDLGTFFEIEAIDYEGTIGSEQLQAQCQFFLDRFKTPPHDFIAGSYSDLLIQSMHHQKV